MHVNCEYFTSNTERELKSYSKQFITTHSHLEYNEHFVVNLLFFWIITTSAKEGLGKTNMLA